MKPSVKKSRRVVLVTGASRGIGRVIALRCARDGYDVAICARDRQALLVVKKEIEAYGAVAHVFALDLTDSLAVKKMFVTLAKVLGRLDALVNNAGSVGRFGGFFDLEDSDWNTAFRVNFMSAVYCAREAVPYLRKSSAPRIVNICAVPARQPGGFNPHYAATKAALLNLTKYLANLLASDGITANAVCPATIMGADWEDRARDRASRMHMPLEAAFAMMRAEDEKKIPLGRLGAPEDVAGTVSFLLSLDAGFITGSCIDVDGGAVRSIF